MIDLADMLCKLAENSPSIGVLLWLVWRQDQRTQRLFDACIERLSEIHANGKVADS